MERIIGAGIGAILIAGFIILLNVIANWKLLSKAGVGGWQSLIPVWNTIARYGVSWTKAMGVLVIIFGLIAGYGDPETMSEVMKKIVDGAALAAGIIAIIEKFKLSRVYGHGTLFALGLIFLEPLFIVILAFGGSRYRGKRK